MRIAICLFLVLPLYGAEDVVMGLSPHERERFERLSEELVAPCCWHESLGSHRSPAADEMRETLALRIRSDWSDKQIVDAFVSEHSARVLVVPRDAGVLYWTPAIVLGVGLIAAAVAIVSLLRRKPQVNDQLAADGPRVEIADEDIDW